MTALFPASSTPRPFDGTLLFSVDGGNTVWSFPNASIQVSDTDNVSRPDVIDASEISHVKINGVRMGGINASFFLMPDRDFAGFLNAGFGPRTNQQLTPFIYNIIPNSGAGVIKGTGVWFSRVTISGSFGTSGQQAANTVRLSGMVMDIDNVYAAPTLVAPATTGTNGLGVSSFDSSSFTNGAGTAYDKIRSYSFTLDNQLAVIPGIVNSVARLAAGCQPGTLRGALTMEQLAGPANPLPGSLGEYPIGILLPTGDNSKKLTILTNASRDGSSLNLVPTEFIGRGQLYSIWGVNNLTSGWLFNASYP